MLIQNIREHFEDMKDYLLKDVIKIRMEGKYLEELRRRMKVMITLEKDYI